jgi:mitogen-activated protein kinase 1/3
MLDMNPTRRISAAEALKHPFFEGLHDEEDEPVYTGAKIDFFFEQDQSLTLEKIQNLLMK